MWPFKKKEQKPEMFSDYEIALHKVIELLTLDNIELKDYSTICYNGIFFEQGNYYSVLVKWNAGESFYLKCKDSINYLVKSAKLKKRKN